jgi:hypothetical protein
MCEKYGLPAYFFWGLTSLRPAPAGPLGGERAGGEALAGAQEQQAGSVGAGALAAREQAQRRRSA